MFYGDKGCFGHSVCEENKRKQNYTSKGNHMAKMKSLFFLTDYLCGLIITDLYSSERYGSSLPWEQSETNYLKWVTLGNYH